VRIRIRVRIALALAAAVILLLSATLPHAQAGATGGDDQYLSPSEMAFSPDGRLLYVVCERSDQLLVLNAKEGAVLRRIRVGHIPRAVAVSPDGRQAFVTNSWDDTVSVIDAASASVTRTIATGAEPYGVVVDRAGKTLYVANRISSDVSLIDLASGVERKRLMAGRGASYLAISADGSRVYCTHVYPRIGAQRTVPQSEVTVIDTAREAVVKRIPLDGVAGMFHVALSADGRLGVVAQMRPKNLVPLAHVEHGWVFGHSLTVFGSDVSAGADAGSAIEVPLDELEHYYSLQYGVAITPDKSRIFVTASGSDIVTVIDTKCLLAFTRRREKPFVNDLSASAAYVMARIAVGKNPRGVAMSPDGKRLYVANRMDDTLSVIDATNNKSVATIDLGGPKNITALRRGEQLFTTSRYAFQGQFSCANCHIDSTFDGLTWDLEPDGFGKDIVDNRLIEDLAGTEPFKWNGGNPSMAQECGPRTEMYFYRSQSYSPRELADLVEYIYNLPSRPNRFRLTDGQLTTAQERGKAIFYRTVNKFGKAIPEANQCAYCHSGPKHTSQKQFDVGTGKWTDRSPIFDTPQLVNIALTAPYLHDESARSLEEIWTVFNPHDQHGATNDLTKDELNDLIEYLRTL
jgi:YVTN family beta-propeller protein